MPPPSLDPAKTELFKPPPAVPPQTFELGLVLGGTVSAGAYTAGALDLLIQALDAFASQTDPPPPHHVRVRLAAGSSGGAVTASIFGVSLNRSFTHVAGSQQALNAEGAGPADNKFWDLWVNRLQFLPMLDTDDLDTEIQDPGTPLPGVQHVPALLNGHVIDTSVQMIVDYAGQGGDITRPWAVSPFRLATTVCNLRGMPFRVAAAPALGHFTGSAYVEHDDYAWFALPNVLGKADGAVATRLPNEFWLSTSPAAGITVGYDILGDYARASGAMPVGLPGRPLTRPAEHYLYRPFAHIDDSGNVRTAWPAPDFSELAEVADGQPYQFTGVDGGTLNNDPVKIAHDALTGIGLHNPQAPETANRALFLIDPLADQPTSLNPVGLSIVGVLKGLLTTFIGGARYLTSDLALFQSEDVFSRYQLVPTRDGRIGEAALAGTDLAALGGWCAREFRVHDYLLGQKNMLDYLREEFTLRADNPLFDKWSLDLINDFSLYEAGGRFQTPITAQTPRTSYWLPVIPIPPDGFGITLPAWPTIQLDTASLQQAIQTRADGVLKRLRTDNLPGFAGWLIALVVLGGVASTIARDVVQGLVTSLKNRGLLQT